MNDDGRLVARVLDGDRQAAEQLFAACWPEAWRAAVAVCGRSAEAEDVAQEAVVRLFERLDRYDQSRPFLPWARRVLANTAISSVRRQRPNAFELDDVSAAPEPAVLSQQVDEKVAGAVVVEAVERLSDPLRVVVVLRYWLDLTIPEIADAIGIAEGTVASRMSRATAQLRSELVEAKR